MLGFASLCIYQKRAQQQFLQCSRCSSSQVIHADTAEGTEEWQPVSAPPPPPDPQATLLVETEFDLPVRDFYKEFLSDKVFLLSFKERPINESVSGDISDW